jgi:phosphotransferase system  glucose/maltose/N-acetylglucosamine-specific IIC component
MKRIGIAASKIAKGNIVLYNIYVILIALLVSLLLFVLAGATILFALILIRYVANEVMGYKFEKSWWWIFSICMVCLSVVIAIFNLMALFKNIKFSSKKFQK